jgi:hypothetical protein
MKTHISQRSARAVVLTLSGPQAEFHALKRQQRRIAHDDAEAASFVKGLTLALAGAALFWVAAAAAFLV